MNPWAVTAGLLALYCISRTRKGTGSENDALPIGLIPGLAIRVSDQDALVQARESQDQRVARLKTLKLKGFKIDRSPSLKSRRGYDWTAFRRANPEIEFYSDLTIVRELTPYAAEILANWQHFNPRKNRNLEEELKEFNLGHPFNCLNPNILKMSPATDKKLNLRTGTAIPWTKKKMKAIKNQVTAPTDLIHFLEYHSVPYEVVPEAATPLDLWHCPQ